MALLTEALKLMNQLLEVYGKDPFLLKTRGRKKVATALAQLKFDPDGSLAELRSIAAGQQMSVAAPNIESRLENTTDEIHQAVRDLQSYNNSIRNSSGAFIADNIQNLIDVRICAMGIREKTRVLAYDYFLDNSHDTPAAASRLIGVIQKFNTLLMTLHDNILFPEKT